ncbi:hypothetical protein [Halolamina sediminis]|uniref:hypothetical protein n=1 Tax=Halolamina sediminis TaxID=1480675 RepID=UPI0006B4E0B7|nr:hypothetical protein [Halolamina sediminis]
MDLYRTSESGVVPVQPLDPGETAGLAGALLQGPGGSLGGDDVLFVTTAAGDGAATALALDAEGSAVVVGAVDGELGSDAVTDALQRASTVADHPYEALDEQYDGGSLREAHAEYFHCAPLDPGAFNEDQRVRLLGTAFADEALDLATFLSDRELAVDAVRIEAFGAVESEEFLVRFVADDDGQQTQAADSTEEWVAGTNASAAAATGEAASGDDGAESDAPTHESALAASDGVDDDVGAEDETGSEDGNGADGRDGVGSGDGTDEGAGTDGAEEENLELPTLLDAVAEGVADRLVGTFDADPEEMVSVERGNELLVRPDHPAYAGGVLRYRLQVDTDGTVEFGVNIYGGSEAEKEQMRAVVRENEAAIEEELEYEIADGYDGFAASRQFATFDQVAAAEIVDEFDRLVRLFHSRVMRA